MEKVTMTHYYSSYNYEKNTIIKNFVGKKDEVNAVIEFEDKLRTILDKYRTKDELIEEISICSKELNNYSPLFPKARRKHFKKALIKAENDYSIVLALSDLINKNRNVDFKYLLFFIIKYAKDTSIIKTYIKSSKYFNYNRQFTKYFLDDGSLDITKLVDFNNYLKEISRRIPFKETTDDLFFKFRELFYTKEQYDIALLKQKQLLDEEILRKKEERSKELQLEKERLQKELAKRKALKESSSIFLDLNGRLNQFASDYDEEIVLDDILKKKGNKKIDYYRFELHKLKAIKEIKILCSVNTNNDDANLLLSIIRNERKLIDAIDIIYSDEYINAQTTEDKKNILIENFIEQTEDDTLITSDSVKNLFIFPTDNFINDEIKINNDETKINFELIKTGILSKFKALQSSFIDRMKYQNSDITHMVLDKGNTQYRINEDMKLFRFGHRVSKLCYVTIDMHDANRKILQDRYNLDDKFHVLAVVSFGNVRYEDEESFYERSKKEAKKNESSFKIIQNIFKYPFNDETMKIAFNYIESGKLQLSEAFDYNYLENKQNKKIT